MKNDSQLKALLELNDEIADHVYVAHADGILRYGFFLFIFFLVHMPYILGFGIIFVIVIIYVAILLKVSAFKTYEESKHLDISLNKSFIISLYLWPQKSLYLYFYVLIAFY